MNTKSDLIREAQNDPNLTIPSFDSDVNIVQEIKARADKMHSTRLPMLIKEVVGQLSNSISELDEIYQDVYEIFLNGSPKNLQISGISKEFVCFEFQVGTIHVVDEDIIGLFIKKRGLPSVDLSKAEVFAEIRDVVVSEYNEKLGTLFIKIVGAKLLID